MQRNGPPPPLPPAAPAPGVGIGARAHQACAACRHQRRKCSENCELAAWFPADRAEEFAMVLRVFGVNNLSKLLRKNRSPASRRLAADTLVWEASWRLREPAEGCYAEVVALREENVTLRRQIAMCAACHMGGLPRPPLPPPSAPVTISPPTQRGLNGYNNAHMNHNGGGHVIHDNRIGGQNYNNFNPPQEMMMEAYMPQNGNGNVNLFPNEYRPHAYMQPPGAENGGFDAVYPRN